MTKQDDHMRLFNAGFTQRQIAAIRGVNESTVSRTRAKALEAIRSQTPSDYINNEKQSGGRY